MRPEVSGGAWRPAGPPQDATCSDAHALIKERLLRPRSLFAPGHRMRMNILPVMANFLLPWMVFVFCCGTMAFRLMYNRPALAWFLIVLVVLLWLVSVAVAIWARWRDPDPTWFSYFAMTVGIATLFGTTIGQNIFLYHSRPYYQVRDLKVARGIDASVTGGSAVSDAGIIHFSARSRVDGQIAWHFKAGALYCVAPIISNASRVPLRQTYDFWAVGKDCCSMSSADFRCGAWGRTGKRSGGIRVVNEGDAAMYRLAVQQTASLYNIMAPEPIFIKWSADPDLEVGSWYATGFKLFLSSCTVAFITSLFSVSMATCRFSWLGRATSVYDMALYDDPSWGFASYKTPMDHSTKPYYSA